MDQFLATLLPLSDRGDGLKSLDALDGPAVVPSRLLEVQVEEEVAVLLSATLGRDGPASISVSARRLASAVLPTGR